MMFELKYLHTIFVSSSNLVVLYTVLNPYILLEILKSFHILYVQEVVIPILYNKLLHKMGNYFLDTQYSIKKYSNLFTYYNK